MLCTSCRLQHDSHKAVKRHDRTGVPSTKAKAEFAGHIHDELQDFYDKVCPLVFCAFSDIARAQAPSQLHLFFVTFRLICFLLGLCAARRREAPQRQLYKDHPS